MDTITKERKLCTSKVSKFAVNFATRRMPVERIRAACVKFARVEFIWFELSRKRNGVH